VTALLEVRRRLLKVVGPRPGPTREN